MDEDGFVLVTAEDVLLTHWPRLLLKDTLFLWRLYVCIEMYSLIVSWAMAYTFKEMCWLGSSQEIETTPGI